MRLFIDDKPATVAEVCTALNIDPKQIPYGNRSRKFERIGVKGKIDPQTKKPIVPRGHGIPCTINVTNPKTGDVLKITYAETARQETRNGLTRTKYIPLSLMLSGFDLTVMEDEKIKFFMLYIHPYNKQSPLNRGKANPNVLYEFQDTEQKAREEERAEEILYEAIAVLKGLGDTEAVQIAKGYNLHHTVESLSIPEVRQLLRNKMKQNPANFIMDIERDNEIALKGIIQDAIDKGVLVGVQTGTTKVWTIGDHKLVESRNGDDISYIKAQIETDMDLYMPMLMNSISKKASEGVLKKPENSKYFDNFKINTGSESYPTTSQFDKEDHRTAAQIREEEANIKKLRYWYTIDMSQEGVNTNTKNAIKARREEILAQFNKDKESGVIPADTPAKFMELETA